MKLRSRRSCATKASSDATANEDSNNESDSSSSVSDKSKHTKTSKDKRIKTIPLSDSSTAEDTNNESNPTNSVTNDESKCTSTPSDLSEHLSSSSEINFDPEISTNTIDSLIEKGPKVKITLLDCLAKDKANPNTKPVLTEEFKGKINHSDSVNYDCPKPNPVSHKEQDKEDDSDTLPSNIPMMEKNHDLSEKSNDRTNLSDSCLVDGLNTKEKPGLNEETNEIGFLDSTTLETKTISSPDTSIKNIAKKNTAADTSFTLASDEDNLLDFEVSVTDSERLELPDENESAVAKSTSSCSVSDSKKDNVYEVEKDDLNDKHKDAVTKSASAVNLLKAKTSNSLSALKARINKTIELKKIQEANNETTDLKKEVNDETDLKKIQEAAVKGKNLTYFKN